MKHITIGILAHVDAGKTTLSESILYLTGYLTQARENEITDPLPDNMSALKIPNAEIREIFETTVVKWFSESVKTWNRKALFDAAWSGQSEILTQEMSKLLRKTISYHDYREDFYHAFLCIYRLQSIIHRL